MLSRTKLLFVVLIGVLFSVLNVQGAGSSIGAAGQTPTPEMPSNLPQITAQNVNDLARLSQQTLPDGIVGWAADSSKLAIFNEDKVSSEASWAVIDFGNEGPHSTLGNTQLPTPIKDASLYPRDLPAFDLSLQHIAWAVTLPSKTNPYGIVLWEVTGKGPTRFTLDSTDTVVDQRFSADAKFLAVYLVSGYLQVDEAKTARLQVWDISIPTKERLMFEFQVDAHSISDALVYAFSEDGALFAVRSSPNSVEIWDVASGKHRNQFQAPVEVQRIAFNRKNTRLATASSNGLVTTWDLTTDKQLPKIDLNKASLPVGSSFVNLALSPDGNLAAIAASYRQPISLWDISTGQLLRELSVQSTWQPLGFRPDGKILMVTDSIEGTEFWGIDKQQALTQSTATSLTATATLSPDAAKFKVGDSATVVGKTQLGLVPLLDQPSSAPALGSVACSPETVVKILAESKDITASDNPTIYYKVDCGAQGWLRESDLSRFQIGDAIKVQTKEGHGIPLFSDSDQRSPVKLNCPENTLMRVESLFRNSNDDDDFNIYVGVTCNNENGFVFEQTLALAP